MLTGIGNQQTARPIGQVNPLRFARGRRRVETVIGDRAGRGQGHRHTRAYGAGPPREAPEQSAGAGDRLRLRRAWGRHRIDDRKRSAERRAGLARDRDPCPALFEEYELDCLAGAVLGIGIGRQVEMQPGMRARGGVQPIRVPSLDAVGENNGAAPAWSKPQQRGAQVAKRGMSIAPPPLASREGRIDEYDARHQLPIEHIVDQFAIMRAQPAFGKGVTQQTRAPGIDLIEKEARAGEMGVYGKEACPGRGLEHDIVCRDRGCLGGKETDRRRCRELLECDLRFATHALRGKRCRHGDQLGEPRIRICRERRVLQMEDLREFEHIVGVAQ